MAVSEFTKYFVVFVSSLAGTISGYHYSNSPANLRARLERSGKKVLRAGDELWMYSKLIRQRKDKVKKALGDQLKDYNEGEPTEEETLKLLNWCQERLSEKRYNYSSFESEVAEVCEYLG